MVSGEGAATCMHRRSRPPCNPPTHHTRRLVLGGNQPAGHNSQEISLRTDTAPPAAAAGRRAAAQCAAIIPPPAPHRLLRAKPTCRAAAGAALKGAGAARGAARAVQHGAPPRETACADAIALPGWVLHELLAAMWIDRGGGSGAMGRNGRVERLAKEAVPRA